MMVLVVSAVFIAIALPFIRTNFTFPVIEQQLGMGLLSHQDQKNIPVCPGGPRGTGIEEEPEKSSLSLQL
jgi:hypothetical protein